MMAATLSPITRDPYVECLRYHRQCSLQRSFKAASCDACLKTNIPCIKLSTGHHLSPAFLSLFVYPPYQIGASREDK